MLQIIQGCFQGCSKIFRLTDWTRLHKQFPHERFCDFVIQTSNIYRSICKNDSFTLEVHSYKVYMNLKIYKLNNNNKIYLDYAQL